MSKVKRSKVPLVFHHADNYPSKKGEPIEGTHYECGYWVIVNKGKFKSVYRRQDGYQLSYWFLPMTNRLSDFIPFVEELETLFDWPTFDGLSDNEKREVGKLIMALKEKHEK